MARRCRHHQEHYDSAAEGIAAVLYSQWALFFMTDVVEKHRFGSVGIFLAEVVLVLAPGREARCLRWFGQPASLSWLPAARSV